MSDPASSGCVIILSGPRGCGKTTLIQETLGLLKPAGLDIAGILSLPVEVNRKKVAIDGLDLRSGEIRRLAIRNSGNRGHLITRQWQFDPDAMQWADGVLESSPPCDLLVVDELGVLEFERGRGWLSGLKAVDERLYRAAIVVIRPELLEEARKRWKNAAVVKVTIKTRGVAREVLEKITCNLIHSPKADK